MEPFLGQIMPAGFNFAPRGWALCNGQILPISQYTALFSLLGTSFGGDGRTTFGLPELRGRSIVHVGNGPGLDPVSWGQKGGVENVTLTTAQMPAHNHDFLLGSGVGTTGQANGNFVARNTVADTIISTGASTDTLNSATIRNTGGGQSFNIRNPFLGIYVSIALVGIFPSRS